MKKTIITVMVTIVMMVALFGYFMVKGGFITTEADITTHNYEVYCDGIRVDAYATETFNGVNVNMALNGQYHFGN